MEQEPTQLSVQKVNTFVDSFTHKHVLQLQLVLLQVQGALSQWFITLVLQAHCPACFVPALSV